jgi:hypothetical protein
MRLLVLFLLALAAAETRADTGMAPVYDRNTWPVAIVDRPLVVAPGMAEVQLNLTKDLSTDSSRAQHPLAADLVARYGIADRIELRVDSLGVCFVDCDPLGFFNSLGLLAGYALIANRDLNLVGQLGFGVYNVIDSQNLAGGTSTLVTVIPAAQFGWRLGSDVQIFASATLNLGVLGRDHAFFPDTLALHLEPRFQLASQVAIAPFTGYVARFAHSEAHNVPLGVATYVTPSRAIDLGAIFQFPDIFSHDNIGGTGARALTLFATVRF